MPDIPISGEATEAMRLFEARVARGPLNTRDLSPADIRTFRDCVDHPHVNVRAVEIGRDTFAAPDDLLDSDIDQVVGALHSTAYKAASFRTLSTLVTFPRRRLQTTLDGLVARRTLVPGRLRTGKAGRPATAYALTPLNPATEGLPDAVPSSSTAETLTPVEWRTTSVRYYTYPSAPPSAHRARMGQAPPTPPASPAPTANPTTDDILAEIEAAAAGPAPQRPSTDLPLPTAAPAAPSPATAPAAAPPATLSQPPAGAVTATAEVLAAAHAKPSSLGRRSEPEPPLCADGTPALPSHPLAYADPNQVPLGAPGTGEVVIDPAADIRRRIEARRAKEAADAARFAAQQQAITEGAVPIEPGSLGTAP